MSRHGKRWRLRTETGPFTWWTDPRDCSHANDDACPTCDHDGYHQRYIHDATCPKSQIRDGLPGHGWKFDGDDPYIVCSWCGEIRDALTGRVIRKGTP